jgi:hypothetical protein
MRIHPQWRYHPFAPFDRCPSCLGNVRPAVVNGRVNFVCASCGCCWHVFLGYLSLIDPRTCEGCDVRSLCSTSAYLDCVTGERRPVAGTASARPDSTPRREPAAHSA